MCKPVLGTTKFIDLFGSLLAVSESMGLWCKSSVGYGQANICRLILG